MEAFRIFRLRGTGSGIFVGWRPTALADPEFRRSEAGTRCFLIPPASVQ